jgi:hypothetical protein
LPKSTDNDEAIRLVLASDAALTALMPDGVYFDAAPPGLKHFVVLALVSEEDTATFEAGRTIEDALYRIQAVALDTSADTAAAAADRIDALLEDVALVVADYSWMTTHREGRVRGTPEDPVDPSVHWQVIGGNYRVQMAPVWG